MTNRTGKLTIFYDGACPLCTAEMSVYRKCAGAEEMAFVDVSAQASGSIAPDLDKADALKRFHVRRPDGSFVSGAAGFGHLWLALPAWRWLGRVVLMPGILQVTELVYRSFLVFRPALQRIWRSKAAKRVRR